MVVVGLDIGTKNIRVVVAESKEDSRTEVLAFSTVPSAGIANGVIQVDFISSLILVLQKKFQKKM